MDTSVASKAVFTLPNCRPVTTAMAWTIPSPGTISTRGATSTLMPKASTAQPRTSTSTAMGREEISSQESRPTAELTPADVKRLGMLQDARMFQGEYFTHVRNGKGGRERLSPIIGPNAAQIVQRIQETPGEEKVWQHVHQSADIHGYRAEYATAIYKAHARAIQDIPYDRINRGTGRRYQSQVYTCRKDEAGRKLDKAAMLVCSKALGHNRISVVADNYIRGL